MIGHEQQMRRAVGVIGRLALVGFVVRRARSLQQLFALSFELGDPSLGLYDSPL